MLYFTQPTTDGTDYVFKPNIVEYMVAQKSELGKQIGLSSVGIVIHREVSADGTEGPLKNGDIFEGNEVLVVPPVTVSDAPSIDDSSVKELPHIIQVSLAFTPIHNFLPQKGNVANNPDQRYIALSNNSGKGNYDDEYKSYLSAKAMEDIENESIDADIAASISDLEAFL